MWSPRTPSVSGSDVPIDPDPDDWREANLVERSEEARINEADDDSAHVVELAAVFGPADADEADVIEQHQPVDGDDEEDAPRVSPSVSPYE